MNQIPPTTFDFWTLLFSGFAFIGLFYSIKILTAGKSDKRSRILGIYILLQSITLLEYVFYWTYLIQRMPWVCEISLLFPLLYGPLLMIYLDRSFGNEKPLMKYRYHFIPFIVLLLFKIPFYISPSQLKLFHTHDILFGKYFDYYPWFMLWHMSAYGVMLFMMIKNQSGVGAMRLWAKYLVGFFIAFIALSLTYYLLSYTQSLTTQSDYFISLASCGSIIFISWFGHGFDNVANGKTIEESLMNSTAKSKSVSSNEMIIVASKSATPIIQEESKLDDVEKYRHSGLPKSLASKLSDDLEQLMQTEKLYHQNDLRLETLAEKLNSNKHFVSQVINQNFKVNFFEYINLKRIEEAKQLLRTAPRTQLNVIEIAYSVGFNNKGTFNSVFKKVTGVTPSEFRKQSQQLLDTRNN
jgi:AraC-like DNA-binding protein